MIYIHNLSMYCHCPEWTGDVMWSEHACNGHFTCEWVLYLWTGLPTDIGFSTCEWDQSPKQWFHISICTYHAIPRQDLSYTMPCLPGHTIYHAITHQAIPYTMSCPPAISYTMQYLARPYHMPCQARQAISYTMQNIARPYHIPCHAHKAIPYTVALPRQAITIYYVMPDRPCHARQITSYVMT